MIVTRQNCVLVMPYKRLLSSLAEPSLDCHAGLFTFTLSTFPKVHFIWKWPYLWFKEHNHWKYSEWAKHKWNCWQIYLCFCCCFFPAIFWVCKIIYWNMHFTAFSAQNTCSTCANYNDFTVILHKPKVVCHIIYI